MSALYEFDKGYDEKIVGVDEAGRGPLAGPVVAAAVVLRDYHESFEEINDSKKISEKKREKLYDIIMENCFVGVGIANEKEIDEINILNATFLAMRRALEEIENLDEIVNENLLVLVDGNHLIREYKGNQNCLIKGDSKSFSIAAASIIAKVTRDRIMLDYEEKYKGYGFAKHKGYGTKEHREALLSKGYCNGHRKSFLTKIMTKTLF
jgi:ribonuclease HII